MKQDTRMIHQQKRSKHIRTISAKHYRGKERHTIIPDDIARSVYKTRNTVWLPKESGATGLIIGRWRQSVHAQRNASTESFLRWKPNLELDGHHSQQGRCAFGLSNSVGCEKKPATRMTCPSSVYTLGGTIAIQRTQ